MLYLQQYLPDPDMLPGSANQCVFGNVNLRSNLFRMRKSAASLAQATTSLPGELQVRSCFQTMHATWAMHIMLNNSARAKFHSHGLARFCFVASQHTPPFIQVFQSIVAQQQNPSQQKIRGMAMSCRKQHTYCVPECILAMYQSPSYTTS